MATGDVQGSVERLRSELRHIRYPAELDCTGAKLGVAAAFLPVLNYVLLKFSRHVAHQLISSGYELQGKTDARFVEAAFKIFRDKFGLRPVITAAQFLEQGFAERKLMLLSDVIAYCKSFHNAAVRRARLAAASAPSKSGKDGAISSKAGVSQASKGSRKSKAKSGLTKAAQPARVQRHTAAASAADLADAAATLQARLAPSAARLAHPEQSQNTDPNPWGPPAHAVGTHALSGRQVMATLASNVQPRSQPDDVHPIAAMRAAAAHQGQQQQQQQQQQQHTRLSVLPSRTQPKAGSTLEATQAWFMNPAFGSESPLPSPEKQPRSQPPPQPYPSTCTGPAHPQGYPAAGQAQQHPGPSGAPAAASWSQSSPAQQTAVGSAGYLCQLPDSQSPSYSPGMQCMAAPPQDGQLQQPWGNAPQTAVQRPEEAAQWLESTGASMPQQLPARSSTRVAQCSSHSSHHRHGFPSLPARQYQQQHQTSQCQAEPAQHGCSGVAGSLAQQAPQHAQQRHFQSPRAAAHAHGSVQYRVPQQQQQQQQQQDVARQESLSGQQHQQRQEAGNACSDDRMSEYVGQLQERLAEAEEQAAHARLEGERRVQTLEARITVLEGRVRFVEGELVAERERNRPAAKPNSADPRSPHRPPNSPYKGHIAVCLSPSAARSKAQTSAATRSAAAAAATLDNPQRPVADISAVHPVARTTASMQRDGAGASPTRSTAGTPGYKSDKHGCMRQLSLSVHMQQSPIAMRHTRTAVAPASPASSMHSYKSTSELIESIQNRYLEAQSFLRSYKL